MKTFPRSTYQKSQPETRQARMTRQLRTVRSVIFDLPESREIQGGRIIEKLKEKLSPGWGDGGNQAYSDMMLRTYA